MSKVTVIVVNWNGEKFLNDCLGSLVGQTYGEREIILVDNGSTDRSVPFVEKTFPTVKIVELSKNKGFASGNFEGLKAAEGEFIALLNNDARADERWIANLLQPMLENSEIGICASKLLVDKTGTVNSAGTGLTTAGVGFDGGVGDDREPGDSKEFTFGGCGAAVLYRRRMLEEIGFLDEEFFLYDEDTDLSFRAQLAGWKCAYVPTAIVHHVSNATTVRLSDTHVYYHSRNLEFVWIKDMPAGLMLRFAPQKLIQEIGSFGYLCLRHGKWNAYFRAKRDALRMLPLMRQKRKDIQSRRRVSNSYLRSMMTPLLSMALIRQKIRQFIYG